MPDASLTKDVNDLSYELSRVIQNLPPLDLYQATAGPRPTNQFLFELKVLFSLIKGLNQDHWTVAVDNLKEHQIRLPHSHGDKRHYSYFRIKHATKGEWQLVHGTSILTDVGVKRAPDISLQAANADPELPRVGQIEAVWDAKLHKLDAAPVPIPFGEYSTFVWNKERLGVPRPGEGDHLAGWPRAFEVSGLITNGKAPVGGPIMFLTDGVSVAELFGGADTQTSPSRAEHVQDAQARGKQVS